MRIASAFLCVVLALVFIASCSSKKPHRADCQPVRAPAPVVAQPTVKVQAPREPAIPNVAVDPPPPPPSTPTLPPAAAKPRAVPQAVGPNSPLVRSFRGGFTNGSAELRAGALVITERTHVERWTFDADGAYMHCRMNQDFGARKHFTAAWNTRAASLFQAPDQDASCKAVERALEQRESLARAPWEVGEHFEFRAEVGSDFLVIVQARWLGTDLREQMGKEFAAEMEAHRKFLGQSDR